MRRGVSHRRDERAAADEIAEQVADPAAAAVLVFVAATYRCDRLARRLAERLAPVPVYGCTTAGEIGPDGFLDRSAVAIALAGGGLRVGAGLTRGIGVSGFSGGRKATLAAVAALGLEPAALRDDRHVALTFIDGRSGQEELFVAGAAGSAPHIRFLGGSASDYRDGRTRPKVICDGRAWPDSGLVLLLASDSPFVVIKSEHMVPTEQRVVVTRVSAGGRLVEELDGWPARRRYEELIGWSPGRGAVDAETAGRFPLAYCLGGQSYVRSVMAVEGDALRFACAVDHGSVLHAMRSGDLVGTTARDLAAGARAVGGFSALIAFHCLGRFLEAQAIGTADALAETLAAYPLVGYNTFGEQCNALHMNHTLMALGLGRGSDG